MVDNVKYLRKFIYVLILCVVPFILYHSTLDDPFQFDDYNYIVNNQSIRDIQNVPAIYKSVLTYPSRFITFYSFALNHHIHKLDVTGYHMVNLFIHIFVGLILFDLFFLLLSISGFQPNGKSLSYRHSVKKRLFYIRDVVSIRRYREFIAFLAALFFVVHPLQTQAVSYITQRCASLAVMFYVLSIYFFIKGRLYRADILHRTIKGGYFIFSFLCAVTAMFTKEISITLPLIILLVEWLIIRSISPERSESRQKHNFILLIKSIVLLLIFFIVPMIYTLNISEMLFNPLPSASHAGDILTFDTYIMTQARVWIVFLKLFIWPLNQNLDYDFSMSTGLLSPPATIICMFILAGFLISAFKIKLTHRVIAFGIFWFFITLLANLVPRQNVIFEHKMYLVSIGLCISAVLILYRLIKKFRIFSIVMLALIFSLSMLTIERNKVWGSGVSLWEDVVLKSPFKARPKFHLGSAYLQQGQLEKSLYYFNETLKINPEDAFAYLNRGYINSLRKKNSLAMQDYNKAIELKQDYAIAYGNRGYIYKQLEKYDLALADYNKALDMNPQLINIYINRGIIHKIKGDYVRAIADYNKALNFDPENIHALGNRGFAFRRQGELDSALNDFNRVLMIEPDLELILCMRGLAFLEKKQYDFAMEDFSKALQINPLNTWAQDRYNQAFKNFQIIIK